MSVRTAGFFRETHDVEDAPSLAEVSLEQAQPDEDMIVAYLERGRLLLFSPGVTTDALQPGRIAGHGSVLTDGKWVWPDEFAHYVRNYHVPVHRDFVDDMVSSGWRIPEVADTDLDQLVTHLLSTGLLSVSSQQGYMDPLDGLA